MDLGLKGLNVLVTGGTKGIGRRAADMFAAEGANVSICARNADEVNSTVAGLKAQGVTAFGQAVDVGNKAALEAWVADSAKALGGIDIVVANVSRDMTPIIRDRFSRTLIVHVTASAQTLATRLESRGREEASDRADRLTRALLKDQALEADVRIENNGALSDGIEQFVAALQSLLPR